MDDSLLELETELQALRAAPPRRAWLDRIAQDLDVAAPEPVAVDRTRYSSATNLSSWKWLGWRTAAVAAALLVVAAVVALRHPAAASPESPRVAMTPTAIPAGLKPEPTGGATGNRYEPVAATNVIYDLREEGTEKINDQTARRVRVRYLDTYTWKNPKTNASLTWSVPRDEVRVIPASLN